MQISNIFFVNYIYLQQKNKQKRSSYDKILKNIKSGAYLWA